MIHNRIEIDGEKVIGKVDSIDLEPERIVFDVIVEDQDYPPRYVFDRPNSKKASIYYGNTEYTGGCYIQSASFQAGNGGEISIRLIPPIKIEEIKDEPSKD